jgi:signal transduction histidine kinase
MASLDHVNTLLDALIQQAETGAIIPVRLIVELQELRDALRALPAPDAPTPHDPPEDPVAAVMTDQAKFISHAIHELRTPMTSIRGYADMLISMGGMNDMQKQFMDTIRTNARRMEGLLTDVSDMSKLRGGTLRYTLKMDMFKNIAMMIEKMMQPTVEATGRTLTLDLPQGLPLLNTDGELLSKAICKLVENGLRYNERDGGGVQISAEGDGSTLVVRIRDDGIGITPEDLAQLGTVYFRANDDRVRAWKGSGLGVPIAYGIIATLGGTVSVESTPQVGTTFTIRLPAMG